ncbi:Uncharacterised protein [uncultured archaeon]|nr:Uncharacterised protein [uncultured archaeon]
MKKVAFSQDEECWSIAESMVEEIELIKCKEIERLSTDGKLTGSFKGLLIRGVKIAKVMK